VVNTTFRKMITKEQAIKSIKKDLDDDMDILYDAIIEKEYGWLIFCQSKKYIQTKDPLDMMVGSGGTLVEKESGRKYEFGSAYPPDENLKIYELGYLKHDNWDLVITKVNDIKEAAENLHRLGITYVKVEESGGDIWKIPQSYNHKHFKQALETLPARFNLGETYFEWEKFEALKRQSAFEYSLEENTGYVNKIYS
jgi:Immunity protein 35